MIDKIKGNPALKRFIIGLITSHKNPRPRLWVKWFVNPFVHKRGRGAIIRRRRSRIDVFPWRRFEVGRDALIEVEGAVPENDISDTPRRPSRPNRPYGHGGFNRGDRGPKRGDH